jgi:hypothetical protein
MAIAGNKLVGICTGGARNMTGRVTRAVAHLAAGTFPGFFRDWCALRFLRSSLAPPRWSPTLAH